MKKKLDTEKKARRNTVMTERRKEAAQRLLATVQEMERIGEEFPDTANTIGLSDVIDASNELLKIIEEEEEEVRDLKEPTEGREFWESAEWGAADPDYNQRREAMFREFYRKTFGPTSRRRGLACPLCRACNWKIVYVSPYVGMRCEKCKGIQLFDALRAE